MTITAAMNPTVHDAWLLPTATGSCAAALDAPSVLAPVAIDGASVRARFAVPAYGIAAGSGFGHVAPATAGAKRGTATGNGIPAWSPPI